MGLLGKKAIVVGGSVAGMAAAKVLSPYYRDVVIFDADRPGDQAEPRKAVPQGRHVHGLLKGGEDALSGIFPGIAERLISLGAVKASFSRDVRWYLNKRWLPKFESDISIYFQTRPLLENAMRLELARAGNIETLDQTKVIGYGIDADRNHIRSVITERDNAFQQEWPADIVIDASGRAGILPKWLKQNGYGAVPEQKSVVALGYASCFFRPPEAFREKWKVY